jgi:hypothetical protein
LVDDYRYHSQRVAAAVARLGATANPAAIAFVTADKMFLSSLELGQRAIRSHTDEVYESRLNEARTQEVKAREAMADAVFDLIRLERDEGPKAE